MTDEGSSRAASVGVESSPQRLVRRGDVDDEQVHQFVIDAAKLLNDLHCEDIVIFDLRGMSDVTDYIAVVSGTSDRQILSVSRDVEELARMAGLVRFGRDVDAPTTWLVIDFVDVIIHLFKPNTRAYYDLEMMWDDAPRVTWNRSQ